MQAAKCTKRYIEKRGNSMDECIRTSFFFSFNFFCHFLLFWIVPVGGHTPRSFFGEVTAGVRVNRKGRGRRDVWLFLLLCVCVCLFVLFLGNCGVVFCFHVAQGFFDDEQDTTGWPWTDIHWITYILICTYVAWCGVVWCARAWSCVIYLRVCGRISRIGCQASVTTFDRSLVELTSGNTPTHTHNA